MEKTFKILSVDGGGIKGLYSALILKHLEEKFGKISDYFDMLAGTSTGGLIALGLSLKESTSKLCAFYENDGPKIFPSSLFGKVKQVVWGGKYSDKTLENVLTGLFGDRKIEESNNLLCIPSYSITEARPYIFKYDHKEGNLSRDNKVKYVDVALSTSAAPTFFPIHEIKGSHQLIDGGVFANNPTLIAFVEALKYFVGKNKEYSKLEILSISSLETTLKQPIVERNRSFVKWRDSLFDASMNGQNMSTHFFMKTFSEISDISIKYERIGCESISAEQGKYISLDNASKEAIQLIKIKGNDKGVLVTKDKNITSFFDDKKTYKVK